MCECEVSVADLGKIFPNIWTRPYCLSLMSDVVSLWWCVTSPFELHDMCRATSLSHMIGMHMEGRAKNFKKPINISRFPCISQWDILTNR